MGRDPSHLDSHQHVHHTEPIQSILEDLAERLTVPLRDSSDEVGYSDEFYGQTWDGAPLGPAITADRLIKVLASLSPGVTELGCHPGRGNDLDSMYGEERAVEVETLCDPRVRQALSDLQIRLCNFDTRPKELRATA
jgi:predicted glycoside hydrolase/deacetylase ChbG (UPF0249 family)